MFTSRLRLVPLTLALGLFACTGDPEPAATIPTPESRVTSVPACQIEPFYCWAEPFALGAWRGTSGPFGSLVLSDQLCGDYGFCFVARLVDGSRIEGAYFDAPQLVRFTWDGGQLGFVGQSTEGDVLTIWSGPEGAPYPVATLERIQSYCDVASDCVLQSLKDLPCDPPAMRCWRHRCKLSCGLAAGK